MRVITAKKVFMAVLAVFSLSSMGCTRILGIEKSSAARNGDYYPTCLVRADQALDEARMAGKDKQCPDEFKAIKDKVDLAYKVHLGCNTDGACKMSREAIAQVRALTCPEKPVAVEPPPPPAPAPSRYQYCITLHTEFDICKTDIRPEYQNEMTKVGDFMKQNPDTTAVIEGHSDNIPITSGVTCAYKDNMELSQARAESAVNYLVEKFGIDRSRLTAKGYGDTRPVADNATNEGRQQNRRIEAVIDCAFLPQELKPQEKLCITLSIQFDTDKADIKAQYHDELAKLGEYLQKYPTTTATIEGHTDNVGDNEHNMKLSHQRAESVVDNLVNNFGIDRSRLTAKGYGSTRPIAYDNTPEGRQQNRRIEAIVDCVPKK
jgi:OmpA-OmpF porin, OOP family